jgi:uncharacterized membrane protein YdjX (TVP38/TMEM64 family)
LPSQETVLQSRNRKFLWFLIIGIGLAGVAYLVYLSGVLDFFISKNRLLDFIHRHSAYAALIFVGLQAAQVVVAPIPGELTGFVGGMIFGPVWGMVYSTLGLSLGSWLAFMLAKLLGRPLVEKIVSAITRYDYLVQHKGLFLAFLLFLMPGFPKDYLCYLLGLGHMRQRDFLLVVITGRLCGTALLTVGGAYFQSARYVALFGVIAISLLLMLIVMVYRKPLEAWFRRRGRESQEPHNND